TAAARRRRGGSSASVSRTRIPWCSEPTSRRRRPAASGEAATRTASSSSDAMGFTRALVDSVRTLRYENIAENAREVGRQCLLDFLGCALAGAREEPVEILVGTVVRPEGSRAAALVGRSERASRLTAALVNGTAAHAL